MPDQSVSIDEIKLKLVKCDNLTFEELEKLKIYARNPKSSRDLADTTDLINNLSKIIFTSSDRLNSEGLKVLINIATNEETSRCLIAKFVEKGIKKSVQTKLSLEEKFLLCRLLFLVSIDFEGAKFFSQTAEIETFITETFECTAELENCKVVVDILRFRYNLVRNGMIDHEKAVEEASNRVIERCEISIDRINVLGSCLNMSLGNGPENKIIYIGKLDKFIKVLEFLMKMYLSNENKDYLGTALMIAVKLANKEEQRKIFRSHFLASQNNQFINDWKKLLIVSDPSITFLSGEFLLKLCKGNVARFLRHSSFESAAGFLYSKGMLKEGGLSNEAEMPIDPNGESSDEEYFNTHPAVESKAQTHMIPETEEEEQELEYLMKKISDYNAKFQK